MTGAKKRHERYLLESFIDASGLRLEIADDVREAPDFLVRFEGRLVGVEITQLFVSHDANGRLLQAQESISTRIVDRARTLYEKSGGAPAHVSVGFAPGHELRQLKRDDIAGPLASFVRSLDLVESQAIKWRPGGTGVKLPDEIAFVHALGVPTEDMAHWVVPRAGWVAPVKVDALQSRIDEKAPRLSEYQNSVGENWLIIVADGRKPSQLFEVRSDFDPCEVSSPFSRTYFYGHPDRAVVELGTRRALAGTGLD